MKFRLKVVEVNWYLCYYHIEYKKWYQLQWHILPDLELTDGGLADDIVKSLNKAKI